MRAIEALREYFRTAPTRVLTPEQIAEARTLVDVLRGSGAPELLILEKKRSWGGLGDIVRTEELIEGDDGLRLETALAYPRQKSENRAIIAVGSYRNPDAGFSIYVSSDEERLFSGRTDDERLRIGLLRAFGQVTLQMARRRLI